MDRQPSRGRPLHRLRGAPERRLRLLAGAIRLGFLPLALAALDDRGDVATVAVGALIASAPIAVEAVRPHRVPGLVHVAIALAALVEATGRALELYEGHPLPFDLLAHAVEVGAAVVIVLILVHARWPAIAWRSFLRIGLAAVCALVLGLAWEWVESAVDPLLSGTLQHGFDDTAQDVVAGIVGAVLAAMLVGVHWRTKTVP